MNINLCKLFLDEYKNKFKGNMSFGKCIEYQPTLAKAVS